MEMNATIDIDCSSDVVYRFVSDPANDVKWRTGVTESGLSSPPPLTLGSEGFAGNGKQVSRWRIAALTPGRSVDWDLIEGPFGGTGGYRIEENEGRTRFMLLADVKPRGLLRLLGPIFGRMGRRQNQKDVETLKGLLESDV